MKQNNGSNDEQQLQTSRKSLAANIGWEAYLWILFVIQMLSWALMLAGKPTLLDYADPIIKVPGWIGIWCFFRNQQLFLQRDRKYYVYTLIAWEIIFASLALAGISGEPFTPPNVNISADAFKPSLGVIIQNTMIFLPFYVALWKLAKRVDTVEKEEVD